jgi:hypothetical protein
VPVVRRHGHAERRREVHRLRRDGFRRDLAGDDREDRRGRGRSRGGDHLRWAQAPLDGGRQKGPLDHEKRLSAPPHQGACRKERAHEEARRDHARFRPAGDRGGDGGPAGDFLGGEAPRKRASECERAARTERGFRGPRE